MDRVDLTNPDVEPTDEQLSEIMRRVRDDAVEGWIIAKARFNEDLKEGMLRAAERASQRAAKLKNQ